MHKWTSRSLLVACGGLALAAHPSSAAAQGKGGLTLQMDAMPRTQSGPQPAIGIAGGREWRSGLGHVSISAGLVRVFEETVSLRPSSGQASSWQINPRLGAGLRIAERSQFRFSLTGSLGPWLNLVSQRRVATGKLDSFLDVDYRSTAGIMAAEACWIRDRRSRLCTSAGALKFLRGFGSSGGASAGPTFSLSFKR